MMIHWMHPYDINNANKINLNDSYLLPLNKNSGTILSEFYPLMGRLTRMGL